MTLDEIRTEIDKIDGKMKELFIKRMDCAKHVAKVKAQKGGDVYVPKREQEIIELRSSDIDAKIREEYIAFQRHLMSVCRRYEYGLLDDMQEQVVSEALEEARISADEEHCRIKVRFLCSYGESGFGLFVNMANLNRIGICGLDLKLRDGKQEVVMTLDGDIHSAGVRRLLCQIGKEAEGFRIVGLY